jgi:hypothetical protein
MNMSVGMPTTRECLDSRVKFDDTVSDDDVGMKRGSVVPANPSTECDRGNTVIFSAEVYDH